MASEIRGAIRGGAVVVRGGAFARQIDERQHAAPARPESEPRTHEPDAPLVALSGQCRWTDAAAAAAARLLAAARGAVERRLRAVAREPGARLDAVARHRLVRRPVHRHADAAHGAWRLVRQRRRRRSCRRRHAAHSNGERQRLTGPRASERTRAGGGKASRDAARSRRQLDRRVRPARRPSASGPSAFRKYHASTLRIIHIIRYFVSIVN